VNAVGRGTDTYQLRGQPDQPVVVSGTQSTGQTYYLLGWQVWTPASLPILNQSILYRLRKKVRRNNDLLLFTLKKVTVFPVPSRDVTNQNLPGRELLNYSRPGRVWLGTSRPGTGETTTW
jgi:hypothetical protein